MSDVRVGVAMCLLAAPLLMRPPELHSHRSIGIHFGLIDYAGESYDAPGNDLIAATRAHGVEAAGFVVPR